MRRTFSVAVILFVVLGMGLALARMTFYNLLIKQYPSINSSRIDFCLCHTNKLGGGERSSYGKDWEKSRDFKAIEQKDSDGDKYSNIAEIMALTNPGDPMDFPVDNDPPSVEITFPKKGDTIDSLTFKALGRATDNASIKKVVVKCDDERKEVLVKDGRWEVELKLKKSGAKKLFATAYDMSDNETTATVEFKVDYEDVESPKVFISYPLDTQVIDFMPIKVQGIATDDGSIAFVEYSINAGKDWSKATGTDNWFFILDTVPEGEFKFKVRALDASGNMSSVYERRFYVRLPEIPAPTISYPVNGMTVDTGNITISGITMLPAVGVKIRVDEGNPLSAKSEDGFWQMDVNNLKPGTHKIEVCPFDRYNRVGSSCVSAEFTYTVRDTTPPTINLDSPRENVEYEVGKILVSGTAQDETQVQKVEISLDGVNWILAIGKEKWSHELMISKSGSYRIYVRAFDSLGNFNKEPISAKFNVLPLFEIQLLEADSDMIKDGLLRTKVKFTRRLEILPEITIVGSTANLSKNAVNNQEYEITATLGGGISTVKIKAIFQGKPFEASKDFMYNVEVKMAVGSKTMIVNGMNKSIPAPPVIIDGRTYIPFRSIGEALRAEVFWDEKKKEATYKLGTNTYTLILGSTLAKVNGKVTKISNAPLMVGGRLMMPIRVVADLLKAKIEFNQITKIITLTMP
jgi:hypothetical protein